jgi:hypothetical protein
MSEMHPVAAAVVNETLRDFEKRSEENDFLKVTDYIRLVEELDEVLNELPVNMRLQWED